MLAEKETDTLVMVVEDSFREKPFKAAVGDLFLTLRGLHYIPYSEFQFAGKLGGFVGAMIGGLAGGVAVAVGDKQNAESALQNASQTRIQHYGLSLQERMPASEWAVTIPRENIESLDVSTGLTVLTCRTRDGQTMEFLVPKLNHQAIQTIRGYLSSATSTEADTFQYGFNIPYPAPVRLLESLKKETSVALDTFHLIAANSKYLEILYLLLKQQRKSDIAQICQVIARADSKVPQILVELARKDIKGMFTSTNHKVLYGGIAFFITLLILIDRACLSKGEITNFVGNTLLFLGVIALAIVGIFWPLRKPRTVIRNLQ